MAIGFGPLRDIVAAVVPPSDPTVVPDLRRWMWAVFFLLTGVILAVTSQILLTWGIVSVFGFSGFAYAGDIQTVQQSQVAIQHSLDEARKEDKAGRDQITAAFIGQQLFNLRIMQCEALKSRNQPLAQSYAARIDALETDFARAATTSYREEACSDLGLAP